MIETALLERKPPFDLEAEAAVLGSMFLNGQRCDDVRGIVRVDDFYDDAHRRIYATLQAMRDEGLGIDVVTFADCVRTTGDFEAVGGLSYLYKIIQSVPNDAHAVYHAKIVADKAKLRGIINACMEGLQHGYEAAEPFGEILNRVETNLFALRDERSTKQAEHVGVVLDRVLGSIQRHLDGDGEVALSTSFTDLDKMTGGGMRPGELWVLAARTSMGKSSAVTDIAVNAAKGVLVHVSSIEMTSENLCERMMAPVADVAGSTIRERSMSESAMGRLHDAAAKLGERSLYLDDRSSVRVGDIAASVRMLSQRTGQPIGLIVVDYLQQVECDEANAKAREREVALVTKRLKGLAKSCKCPVLCVAQVSRKSEAGNDKRPTLSTLRESGSIEQDADVVIFVHREDYYLKDRCPEDEKGVAEIIVAKQRNGPCGTVKLLWDERHTTFKNLAQNRYQEFDDFNSNSAPPVDDPYTQQDLGLTGGTWNPNGE